jgi:glycosyltransferase involved in cell wall biosynthesis
MTQSKLRKKRILYFGVTPGVGGSIINVLYPVVTGLDRDRYEPLVLFYWSNPYRERFETLGVKTIVFEKPRPRRHPTPIAQLQKNRVVRNLQQGNGRGKALYHALGSYVRLSYCIPQILELAKLIKVHDIDLVHINGTSTGSSREIVLAAKLMGVPCICYAQGFSEFQAVDRQIARLIDQYVFCSNAVGEHCMTLGGVIPAKSCTIYPGVPDVEKWFRPYDASRILREFGWSDQDFIVGNVGRLVDWKGQDVFLKAMAEVKREIPDVKGLLVGEPDKTEEGPNGEPSPFYQHLLALTESLKLTDNVCFTGFRSDIPGILAAVDVLVHSSTEPEPFAATVIEGMMAGRPVIATKAGGMPEMVKDGVTGLLVPPRDPKAMAQAILFYYRDQARARQIAIAGQQRARTDLTAERHANEFYALYQTLLA